MKPSEINEIMDITQRATKNGYIFIPLFIGPPGVGKSHIVQAWAKQNNLPFIDLRIAYMEAPDLIGFPSIETVDGRQVTVHNVPEFLPHKGEGVLLIEEPNRGTTSVMNCLMQLLTDRTIHKYKLPPGWMIVGCINPDSSDYDTNSMDPALKNRFVTFNVTYDKLTFIEYMEKNNFHKDIIDFIESNTWTFTEPENIQNTPGSKFISPRTISQLNSVMRTNLPETQELTTYESVLGTLVGKAFYNFRHNERPISLIDLQRNPKASLDCLAKYSDSSNYKNGMISITIKDILRDGTIDDDLLTKVLLVIPVDQGMHLITELNYKRGDDSLEKLLKKEPKLKELYKKVYTYGK